MPSGYVPVLDRVPKGRNETSVWLRHRDKYEKS
jgi:predicted dithiol-disulfide oxidoreductase (DUF899 family)